jgi:hypothetical protein
MSAEIKDALERILMAAVPYRHSSQELVCFCPMRGAKADGRLMLVGRALYGWPFPFKSSDMSIETIRAKLLEETVAFSSSNGDPIQHLHDGWVEARKTGSKYSAARSSFWMVAKAILKEISGSNESQNLLSHLYWTNLYKLSLYHGGNPGGSLRKIQSQPCQEMLATEIRLLAPQKILFLTGGWWAEPFLKNLNFKPQETGNYSHVYQTGFLSLNNGTWCSVVVADHPERKRRSIIIADIFNAFSSLSQLANPSS